MKFILLTTLVAIMAVMQVPALAALNIDDGAPDALPEAPTAPVTAPAEQSGWAEQVQDIPAPVQAELPVVAPTGAPAPVQPMIVEVSTQRVQDSLCFKTREDMRILNTRLPSSSPFSTGAAVPEPGSIAALSAGFGGLLFQLRRTRRRS